MRYLVFGALVAIVLAALGVVAVAWRPAIAPAAAPSAESIDPTLVSRGEHLALIGNCNSCHTRSDGEPYAGGVPFETPFGIVYATNITPDPDTGIGRWSLEAFRRAMHEGVSRNGDHLYPAFPYDHFTKLSDDDVRALYAFLMTRTPIRATAPTNQLSFPFNFRPVIAGWKVLYFTPGRFEPTQLTDEIYNRGQYLTEGLAHCSACHTPRNALGGERRDQVWGGGEAGGWIAPALNRDSPAPTPWTTDQLFTYLRNGFVDHHGVAAGPMQPVVANLGAVPEQDVRAIARYVGSILEPATAERRERAERLLAQIQTQDLRLWQTSSTETTGSTAPQPQNAKGALLYAGACAMCHEPTGLRFSAKGIPLALSKVVALPDPRNLIHVILDGIHAPPRAPAATMPGFAGTFTDDQMVSLITYIRSTFSNQPPWREVESQVHKQGRERGG